MGLSLAVAVAVSRAIRDVTGLETQLKWPNDILYQEKKLCGILLEVHGEYTGPTAVIIGIGVNVRLTEQDKTAIGQACTALEEISHGAIARNALAVALARQVINVTLEFEQSGLSGVLEEWRRGDVFQNRPVTLSLGQNTIHGICRGIDEQGALLVEQEGQVHRYFSGEMTLRAG
jgi:BirA family biotin operon repressor/biotin-[acetyl-CoA-carboxylase] ligase